MQDEAIVCYHQSFTCARTPFEKLSCFGSRRTEENGHIVVVEIDVTRSSQQLGGSNFGSPDSKCYKSKEFVTRRAGFFVQSLIIAFASQRRPIEDAASRNALTRFEKSLVKRYPEALEEIDEEALRAAEALTPMWDIIDGL